MQKLFGFTAINQKLLNVMQELELDILYYGRGTVVIPDYRRLGIAQKFFYTR